MAAEPRGAAFFDLDKTLIEGSSALHFARAAYRHGMLSRRQVVRDGWANLKFRIQGSTDQSTDFLRGRILDAIAEKLVVDLQRLGPDVLAGILPLLYREMLEEAFAHQDAGRPAYIVTAASQELADVLAHVLTFDGGIGMRSEVRDGVYTGEPAGPFTYREGKAEAIREIVIKFPATDLRTSAENVLRGNDNRGYTVPSRATYPHQWNWDSALAALGWAHLKPERAWTELETLAGAQDQHGMI